MSTFSAPCPSPLSRAAVVAGLTAWLGACASTTDPGVVGASRRQFTALESGDSVVQAARGWYAEALSEARSHGRLNQDTFTLERLRRVADRLIPQVQHFRADAPGWGWEVNLIDSSEVNAWCMAGGKIAFYSGIVSKLDLEDDEIAAVMGHEIAHALREHTREQMAQGRAARLGFQIAEMAGIAKPATLERGIWAWQNLISTGFSRIQEAEADRIGLELAARAGYDPDAARRLWEKMRAESGAPSHPLAAFFSTHPSHEARIADLTAMAEVVRPLYIVANRSEP